MNAIDLVHIGLKKEKKMKIEMFGSEKKQFRIGKHAGNFRSEKKAGNVGPEQNGKFQPDKMPASSDQKKKCFWREKLPQNRQLPENLQVCNRVNTSGS